MVALFTFLLLLMLNTCMILYVSPFLFQGTLHPQLKYLPKFVYTRESRAVGLQPGLNQVIPE